MDNHNLFPTAVDTLGESTTKITKAIGLAMLKQFIQIQYQSYNHL